MATLRNILNYLLLALLVGCAPDQLPPVSEAPSRSIGPELTVFPPTEHIPFDLSSRAESRDQGDNRVIPSKGGTGVPNIEGEVEAQSNPPVNPQVDRSPIQQSTDSTLRQRITAIYLAEVGTLEIGKNNHGPGPKKYLAVCGLGEGYAYCACFVKWALLEVGITTRGTAWSPSWATGPEVYYKRGTSPPLEGRSGGVQPGDVFTLYYQNLKRVGHVGFIHTWDDPRADDWVHTVEGNTNGEGSREGDGVHARRRLKRSLYTIGNYIDT